MKNRVIICYVSFLMLLISIAIILISHHYDCEIVKNLGYGVFGSSFVTLLINVSEYFVEKKKNFTLFYTKSVDILNVLSRIRYYDYDKKTDVILTYWLFRNQNTENYDLAVIYKEFARALQEETGRLLSQQVFDKASDDCVSKFKAAASTYIDFHLCNFTELDLIISDRRLLVPFFSKRLTASIREVYSYITFLRKEVNNKAAVIDAFIKDVCPKVSHGLLKENYTSLNELFFRKETEEGKRGIYATVKDELFDKIEKMSCVFYNKKYVQLEHIPQFILPK